MAMVTWSMGAHGKTAMLDVLCRKKERDRDHIHPYKVIEITPPPKNLGIRCFPPVGPEFISQLSKPDFSDVVFSSVALHSSLLPLDQQNLQCGESVTIEGQAYTISAVTHRYQLRKGKYEPSEKRLDVLSTGRYVLNLYLEHLLEKS